MFNITEIRSLEENNSRLQERVAAQQESLHALGKDTYTLHSCSPSYNIHILQNCVKYPCYLFLLLNKSTRRSGHRASTV